MVSSSGKVRAVTRLSRTRLLRRRRPWSWPWAIAVLSACVAALMMGANYAYGLYWETLGQLEQHRQHQEHQEHPVDGVRCVLYDRPPRTGSTTIATALDACLRPKGYPDSFKWFKGVPMHKVVSRMLEQRATRMIHVSRHMYLSTDDIAHLRNACSNLFYVTSARAIRERLLSRAKYELKGRHEKRHVNRRLSKDDLRLALSRVTELQNVSEPYYENYPFVAGASLTPDYVVRSDSLKKDLSKLLRALSCSTTFADKNVHALRQDDDQHQQDTGLVAAVVPSLGNKRYNQLIAAARKGNAAGLVKAAHFA